MIYYIMTFCFLAIPILLIVFWCISLRRYLSAKKRNKVTPDAFSAEGMKQCKTSLINMSIIAGAILAVFLGIIITFGLAIAHM